MDCECCGGRGGDAERFGFWRQPGEAEIVAVANHRRHALCYRCNNEIVAALEATSWWVKEWAKWRALEVNSTRDRGRGREAVASDFLRVHEARVKLYAYFKAALEGRRESLKSGPLSHGAAP